MRNESHLKPIYGRLEMRAKWLAPLVFVAWLASWGTASAGAQAVHIVRLEVDLSREVYRFVPARVTPSRATCSGSASRAAPSTT